MNKLTAFQKRMIVVGIGLLIILFGALQATFKFDIFIKYKRVVDDIIFILMVFAAMLLFSNRKIRPEPEAPKEASTPERTAETNCEKTEDSK
jgi:uncharacterized membrane protein YwzB